MRLRGQDIHHVDLPLGLRFHPDRPRGYHIDFRLKVSDGRWLPPTDRASTMWVNDVIQWGLGLYEHYLAGAGEEWLAGALAAADHLVAEQERSGPYEGGWTYRYRYPHTFALDPPWLMGMAQGQAASLLVRASLETGEVRYADAARLALGPLRRTLAEGGIVDRLPTGGLLLEEYPTTPPSHVLNGAIFALWGLFDVWKGFGDETAGEEFRERTADLGAALQLWDTGTWSLYDLYPHPLPNIASPFYHRLHITQLAAYERISDDSRFPLLRIRFERYQRRPHLKALAVGRKVAFRLLRPRTRWLRPGRSS